MAHHWTSGILARRQAWHGLGIVKPDGFRFDDEDVICETDYEVIRAPLVLPEYYDLAQQDTGVRALVGYRVPGTDGRAQILGTCTDRYTVIQPAVVRGYAQRLADALGDSARPETCIVLRDGRNAIFCLDIGAARVGNEELRSFVLLDSDYSGNTALGVSASTVATVCANTQAMAQRQHNIRIRHTDAIEGNLGDAIQAIVEATESAKAYAQDMLPLVQARLNTVSEYIRARNIAVKQATGILGLPEDPRERILAERRLQRFLTQFHKLVREPQNRTEERDGTVYGIAQIAFEALEYGGRETVRGSKFERARSASRAEVHGRILAELREVYA